MTLLELLVVIIVIGILAALVLSVFSQRRPVLKIRCSSNLKQVGLSFRLWAGDNADKFPMQVSVTNGGSMEFIPEGNVFSHFRAMSNELGTPQILICPEDSKRKPAADFNTGFTDNNISYFVGADADQTRPTTMLAGDRNLALGKQRLPHGLYELTNGSPLQWTSLTHANFGHLALSDGSAWKCNTKQLNDFLQKTGLATNRLVLP